MLENWKDRLSEKEFSEAMRGLLGDEIFDFTFFYRGDFDKFREIVMALQVPHSVVFVEDSEGRKIGYKVEVFVDAFPSSAQGILLNHEEVLKILDWSDIVDTEGQFQNGDNELLNRLRGFVAKIESGTRDNE